MGLVDALADPAGSVVGSAPTSPAVSHTADPVITTFVVPRTAILILDMLLLDLPVLQGTGLLS